VALGLCTRAASADDLSVRLHVVWGGGAERQWQGSISVSEGTLAELRPLGLEADGPGSLVLRPQRVQIAQRNPRSYDGAELLVTAPPEAVLRVELAAAEADDAQPPQRFDIPLASLQADYRAEALDEQQNRLLVRRAPGDAIRVRLNRQTLVFAPGEIWRPEILPHWVGLPAGGTVRGSVQLCPARTSEVLWSTTQTLRVDAAGTPEPFSPVEIPLPEKEGVYDLVVSLTRRSLQAPFFSARPAAQRKVQLIVIGPELPVASGPAEPQLVAEFDPAHPSWWERLARLPQLKLLPGFHPGHLGNQTPNFVQLQSRKWSQLKAGAWQAYPLPIDQVGRPHLLEVEYPSDLPQTLGISIVEPNAAGRVVPGGVDSGVHVTSDQFPETGPPGDGAVRHHRLWFWPRTRSPLVLLTNRREDETAVFGRIRVLAGPERLPPAPPAAGERLVAAYLDRPLFPENFGASDALDPLTERSLSDWQTFYEGGTRLVEYLQHVGYGGIALGVACEGSAIYPSRLLEPTPKYDPGVFFGSGQDPVPKDVLEMLFQLCNRAGLRLIPAVQFCSPLPELEAELRRSGPAAAGIQLVDAYDRSWIELNGTRRGQGVYYNPLDPRVQRAMLDVVRELCARYRHHASFGGVMILLTPEGYSQLPGPPWGADSHTLEHFQGATEIRLPAGPGAAAQRAQLLATTHRKVWLDWRAITLSQLYRKMYLEVTQGRDDVRLYLATAELVQAEPLQRAMRPALPRRTTIGQAFRDLGIDAALYQNQANLVLLRPYRDVPHEPRPSQAATWEVNEAPEVDRHFGTSPTVGTVFVRPSQPLRLPSFDQVSPFGADRTQTSLAAHVAPSGAESRRRLVGALAALDATVVFDGGRMLTLGQEEAVRGLVQTLRGLPPLKFEDVDVAASGPAPVTVRSLRHDGKTYLYVLNDAPWPATVDVRLEVPADCSLQLLGGSAQPALERRGTETWWTARLEAYDAAACLLLTPAATVTETRASFPPRVMSAIRQRITAIGRRVEQLQTPVPLPHLANPGFEDNPASNVLAGWVHATDARAEVRLDTASRHSGSRALRLASQGPVTWVRSEPVPTPATGRLSMSVWLRTAAAERQPPLRLAVEGRLDGKTYYRFAAVGADQASVPLSTQWAQYVFQVDDLPDHGLEQLRVGFDLMGAGEVWIDDVQLFDLSFTRSEQNELAKVIALADLQLGKGELAACQRLLDGYWPRFLEQYVPASSPRMATRPAGPPLATPAPPEPDPELPLLDRLRGMVPRLPRF